MVNESSASTPITGGPVRVLHADDEEPLRHLLQTYLERYDDSFEVSSVGTADEALSMLVTEEFDCIVSDYQMPGMDGLAFLERVRATDEHVPFILFTGRGSEEVASEALSHGVTDYLQKGGVERLELLWNRIRWAVRSHRRRSRLESEARKFRAVFERASDAMLLADDQGRYVDVNQAACELFDVTEEELLGRTAMDFAPPEFDFAAAWQRFLESDREHGEFPLVRPDGSEVLLEYAAVPDVVPGLNLSILRQAHPSDAAPARGEAESD